MKSIFMLLFMLLVSTVQAQTLKLGMNEKAIEQDVAAIVLTQIYLKTGLKADITPLPGARSNKNSLNDEHDGEVARVNGYFFKNNTLVKVEPSYYYLTTTAFMKKGSGVTINTVDDLQQYRIGIVRGIAHAEAATEGIKNLQAVGSYDSLYLMLDAGRIDVAVDTGINGVATIRKLKLNIESVGDIAKHDLYNVLTLKNKALAPKIGTTIKAMKSSGELTKIIQNAEKSL